MLELILVGMGWAVVAMYGVGALKLIIRLIEMIPLPEING